MPMTEVNFTKTSWKDGAEPAINETQLNRIEKGIDDVVNLTNSLVKGDLKIVCTPINLNTLIH